MGTCRGEQGRDAGSSRGAFIWHACTAFNTDCLHLPHLHRAVPARIMVGASQPTCREQQRQGHEGHEMGQCSCI